MAALVWLIAEIDANPLLSVALLAVVGFLGGYFPVIIAHGRAFIPAHLVGRGVTLMNLFGIGGVGLMQFVTGRLHTSLTGGAVTAPYGVIFGFLALTLLIGTVLYLFSRDSLD